MEIRGALWRQFKVSCARNLTQWCNQCVLLQAGHCAWLPVCHSIFYSLTARTLDAQTIKKKFFSQNPSFKYNLFVCCVVVHKNPQSQEPKSASNGSTPPSQPLNSTSRNTRLARMVQQVREVLPQVPSSAISRDLSKLVLITKFE